MFLLIMLALGLVTLALWNRTVNKYDLEALAACIITASLVLIIVAAVTYPTSLSTLANMEAFYKRNQIVYSQAVKEFPKSGKAITKEDSTTVITLPYDMVKLIAGYNTNLTWYRKYQRNWFVGGFVGKASSSLNYIIPKGSPSSKGLSLF